MVPHLDDFGGSHDVEFLGRASLGRQDGENPFAVAEKHDAAIRTDLSERHDGTLDRCLGGEIAAHGVYTNL